MMARVARFSAVAGLVILVATVAFLLVNPHPTHGTGVVGGLTVVFATGFTGLAAACLGLDRARRERPSVAADGCAMLAFLLMLVATPVMFWLVVSLLREI